MSGDGTYAPKSPDLSSFYSAGPTGHQQQQQQPRSQSSGQLSQPRTPGHSHRPSLQYPGQPQSQSQQHLQPPPTYFSPPQPQLRHQPQPHSIPQSGPPSASHYLPHDSLNAPYSPHSQPPQHYSPPAPAPAPAPAPFPASAPPHSPGQGSPQQLPGHGSYGLQAPPAYQNYYQPYGDSQYQHQASPQSQPFSQPPFFNPSAPPGQDLSQLDIKPELQSLQQLDTMPPRRSAAQAAQQQAQIAPSPVKTKFPTARIKRIMQADEEVGKVAQQTPIAVGKALELFMVALVSKSADVAKEKNSKRVTAQMLKHVVESDDQWDFLRDIVGKVENEEKAGKSGKTKAESESEEELPEKKKAKVGRKKKA